MRLLLEDSYQLKRCYGFGPDDPVVIAGGLNDAGDKAGHTYAIRAHFGGNFLTVWGCHNGVHSFGILSSEIENVTDFYTSCRHKLIAAPPPSPHYVFHPWQHTGGHLSTTGCWSMR